MPKGRIRVRLKAYDHRVIDESCEKILETALATGAKVVATGAKVVGPVPLPTHRKLITVTTSPHTDKDAREHFQILTHKRLIDILEPTSKTIDSLMHLEMPAGVDIEIKM
ncbi:30S ribosomal protein S10 [Microgenomates bacterium DG_75]|nr:MAG: 30S ribosomal protein S10 [Microgenomates bacterium DG_75]